MNDDVRGNIERCVIRLAVSLTDWSYFEAVRDEDFHVEPHAVLWAGIRRCFETRGRFDLAVVQGWLEECEPHAAEKLTSLLIEIAVPDPRTESLDRLLTALRLN